jgi:hypothetical protein
MALGYAAGVRKPAVIILRPQDVLQAPPQGKANIGTAVIAPFVAIHKNVNRIHILARASVAVRIETAVSVLQ